MGVRSIDEGCSSRPSNVCEPSIVTYDIYKLFPKGTVLLLRVDTRTGRILCLPPDSRPASIIDFRVLSSANEAIQFAADQIRKYDWTQWCLSEHGMEHRIIQHSDFTGWIIYPYPEINLKKLDGRRYKGLFFPWPCEREIDVRIGDEIRFRGRLFRWHCGRVIAFSEKDKWIHVETKTGRTIKLNPWKSTHIDFLNRCTEQDFGLVSTPDGPDFPRVPIDISALADGKYET